MPPAILTTLKCCVGNAAVCVRACVYVIGVIQMLGKETGNEKREEILLSVFLGNKIYIHGLSSLLHD